MVATAAAFIARAILLDWLRVVASLPGAAVLPPWCVIDKHSSSRRSSSRQERWCANDVLPHTTVSHARGMELHVHVPRHLK